MHAFYSIYETIFHHSYFTDRISNIHVYIESDSIAFRDENNRVIGKCGQIYILSSIVSLICIVGSFLNCLSFLDKNYCLIWY